MDGTTAQQHLRIAMLRVEGAIDMLQLLDGMEQHIQDLYAVQQDLEEQLVELESLEAE